MLWLLGLGMPEAELVGHSTFKIAALPGYYIVSFWVALLTLLNR